MTRCFFAWMTPVTRLTSFGAVHTQAMKLASLGHRGGAGTNGGGGPSNGYHNPGLEESSSNTGSYSSKHSTLTSSDTPINLSTIQANLRNALAARQGLPPVAEDSTDDDMDLPPPPPVPVCGYRPTSSAAESDISSLYDPTYAQCGPI